jgi:protein TonB
MIVTMRSITEAEQPRHWLARESFRRWCLALALEGLLLATALLLFWLLTLRHSAPPVVLAAPGAGQDDDLSVALLSASAEPLRTARFLTATVPAAVPTPASPAVPAAPALPPAAAATPKPTAIVPDAAVPAAQPPVSTGATQAVAVPAATVTETGGVTQAAAPGEGGQGGVSAVTSSSGAAGGNAAAASGSGSGLGSRHARHPYFGKLKIWLNAHKTYPAALKKAKAQGTVVLTFTISRSGELLSSRIVTGSGQPGLDQAALDMLQRSSPMPPLPDELGLDTLTLTIPVEYSLITR